MTGTREAATELLALRTLIDAMQARYNTLRFKAGSETFDRPGMRDIGVVGDVEIGNVQLTKGRRTPKVTDPAALLAWVTANRPDEVETTQRVRPSYEGALLQRAKTDGYAATRDGEVIPGIECVEAAPTLTVRPDADALDVLRTAVAAGAYSLTDLTAPAAIEAQS